MGVLPPGLVRVWVVIADREAGRRARTLLTGDERVEVSRRVGVEADRRAVALAMRRSVLERFVPSGADELVDVDASGVRRLSGAPSLKFSATSHDDVAAIAVAEVVALGIDLEPMHDADWDVALEDVLSDGERRELEALEPDERERAYFASWTVKESVMKALGEGLSDRAPDSIEASVGQQPPRLHRVDGMAVDEPWAIATIEPVPGYVLSIVVRDRSKIELEVIRWSL